MQTGGVNVSVTIRYIFGALVLLLTVPMVGCDEITSSPEEFLAQAKTARAEGDLRAAVIHLKSALRESPEHAESRQVLGQIYVDLHRGASAEKELRNALRLGIPPARLLVDLTRALLLQGKSKQVAEDKILEASEGRISVDNLPNQARAELLALRGFAFDAEGRRSEAERLFDEALAVDPKALEGRLGKATLSRKDGDLEQARRWLEEVISIDSKYAPAWSALGGVESDASRLQEANEAYTKAIEHGLVSTADHMNRAIVRMMLKDFVAAQEDLKILQKDAPKHPKTLFVQGLVQANAGEHNRARLSFEDALRVSPDFMPAVYQLGITNFYLGRLEQAEHHLRRFTSSDPSSILAFRDLAMVLLLRKDYRGAEEVLEKILRQHPDDPDALELLSRVALMRGKTDDAVAHLKRMGEDERSGGKARENLALLYLATSEPAQAAQALEEAQQSAPSSIREAQLLVIAHIRAGELDKALTAAEILRSQHPEEPAVSNLLGAVHMARSDLAAARKAFERALELKSDDIPAMHNLAKLALSQGDVQEARKQYSAILRLEPGHLRSLMGLAELEARAGRSARSLELLHQAVERNPVAAAPRLVLTDYYLKRGQAEKVLTATEDLPGALASNPKLLARRAEALRRTGSVSAAVRLAEQVVAATPQSAASHYLLARTYQSFGDRDSARSSLSSALNIDPQHTPSKLLMTGLLLEAREFEQARRLVSDLKDAQPENPFVHAAEGELALQEGRAEEAAAAFSAALERVPSGQWSRRLARAKYSMGDKQGAIAALEDALESNPSDVQTRSALANVYLLERETASAVAEFEKVLALASNDVLALNNLAELLKAKEPARAMEYAERAYALAPDSPPVLDTLGMLLMQRGDSNRAIGLLRRAAERAPENASIRHHYAVALAATGSKPEAIRTLRALLDAHPTFAGREEAEALLRKLGG